ncbi:MAG: sigma-54 dependent transcriptional regulator [Planctomycetota bacterium]
MNHVWIIDDEPAICWALRQNLELERHHVEVFSSAEAAMERLTKDEQPDVLMLDIRLPGIDGLELLGRLREGYPDLAVIMMTAFGDLETAVQAVRGQAFEYLTKPFDLEEALATVRRALYQKLLKSQLPETTQLAHAGNEILVGRSTAMQNVYKQIAIAAKADTTVLIEGEEGTGKSLVASMIHRFSLRHDQPFLPTNSKIESDYELESGLFGSLSPYEYSGHAMRTGLFELVQRGTVLIEDIDAISIGLQTKLLHVLETKSFHRIGDSITRPLHCRVLFTSNHELEKLISDGDVDRRLASQLEVFRIQLPPLRNRREDIMPLVQSFLGTSNQHRKMQITARAIDELERRNWPGNVRELKSTVERAVMHATGSVIQLEDIPLARSEETDHSSHAHGQKGLQEAVRQWAIARLARDPQPPNEGAASPEVAGTIYEECLHVIEPPLLASVLEFHLMNRAAAANHLGLHRSTLRQKMRRYNIE